MTTSGKFEIEGGRCGWVNFTEGQRMGRFEWEMLIGEFPMVLYARTSFWLKPEERRLSDGEMARLSQEFADEKGCALQIDTGSGCRAVHPTSR